MFTDKICALDNFIATLGWPVPIQLNNCANKNVRHKSVVSLRYMWFAIWWFGRCGQYLQTIQTLRVIVRRILSTLNLDILSSRNDYINKLYIVDSFLVRICYVGQWLYTYGGSVLVMWLVIGELTFVALLLITLKTKLRFHKSKQRDARQVLWTSPILIDC